MPMSMPSGGILSGGLYRCTGRVENTLPGNTLPEDESL
jgi:hypothetical protein